MGSWITTACVIFLVGTVMYLERDQWMPVREHVVYVPAAPVPPAQPAPRPRRLAPAGTFFVVNYVSARTPRGVVGFDPGTEVTLVSADKARGTLVVSDGKFQVPVDPENLTNDLDIAALVKRRDQAGQMQLQAMQESARRAYEQEVQLQNMQHASDVADVHSGSTISAADSAVGQPAHLTNSVVHGYYYPNGYYYNGSYYNYGSPYSYLQH